MKRLSVFFALLLTACPPPIDTGDGGDGPIVVGPSGGLFIRNGFGLNVPAGAVTSETVISVTVVDNGVPDVPARTRISYGYRMSPSSLVFKAPVTIYLPWLKARVPEAVEADTFDMRRQGGAEAYAQLPGTKTNTEPFEAVEAQSDHLGLFWLTSPSEPNVDRIEIDPATVTLSVGGTKQFSAQVITPLGQVVHPPITWSVVPPRVGAVDSTGFFTASAPGTATLSASAGKAIATAKIYVPGTTPGPSSFTSSNPFPTGNDLWGGAIAPAGLGSVFCGDNGTVLWRDPAGAYSRLASVPAVTLTGVGGTSMSNAVAIGRRGSTGVLVEFNGATPALKVYSPTDISSLSALWFDGSSGMAVGSGNLVAIRRNGNWSTEYSPSFETLLAVRGDGLGRFIVVGDLGSIYRWDPVRLVWDSLFDTRLSVKLDAAIFVDFASAEAWAVGGGRLHHFVGNQWVSEPLPSSVTLERTTALGLVDSHVVVGGQRSVTTTPLPESSGVVLVRSEVAGDGGTTGLVTWAVQPLRWLQVPLAIFGQGTAGFVSGSYGAVWVWKEGSFVEESHGFYGDVAKVSVVAEGEVYAAVNECASLACNAREGHVVTSSDAGWVVLGVLPVTEPIVALAARSAHDVSVATASGVFNWNGAAWAPVTLAGAGGIRDLAVCGEQLVAAGANAAVYSGNASMLSLSATVGPFGNATALHCPTPTTIWAAGDGFLSSKVGSAWSEKTSDSINQAAWRAVWSPGGNEGFAFGDARYGVYFDSSTLTTVESLGGILPDTANGLWGPSIDRLYLVGLAKAPFSFGFALRFDGVTWSLVDSGAQREVLSVSGTSTSNLWLGTRGGGLLRAAPF